MAAKGAFINFRQLLPGAVLMITTIILLTGNLPARFDLVFYDLLLHFLRQDSADEVVIVAIDEPSLQKLGRWPWSRRVHAELLDKLTEVGVEAVGFDVLFAEPETSDPEADQLLAEAIGRNGRVVLAVAPGNGEAGFGITEILPMAQIADQAAALGHVDFELDADGVSRRVYLRAGLGDPHWPALGAALASIADNSVRITGKHNQEAGSGYGLKTGWVRDDLILIPFSGAIGSFKHVSYVDVLMNKVPADTLRDRIILIGSTASGLGDALATPLSWDHRRMPGVEMNAYVVNTLLHGSAILPLALHLRLIISLVFVIALSVVLVSFPARNSLLVLLVGLSTVILTTVILLVGFQLWFPPVALLLVLVISYLLYNWYQIQSASRAISQLEHRIRHQARHDPVTRLPNQEMLQEFIQRALAGADRGGDHVGLLILSLDRFREISNRLGLRGGEQLLGAIAERLRKVTQENAMVARLSGGEFAVLMDNIVDEKPVADMGARLAFTFQHPIEVNGQQYFLSPSIGANLYPSGGHNYEGLLHNTYTAMQKARNDKSKTCWFYDERIKIEIAAKADLEDAMHLALQRNEFEIFYQPQVIADNGRIVGVEALLRWRHSELGLIPPAEFIPIAEVNGLIIPIGKWVIEQSCRQAQQWRAEGMTDIRMAVNLSAVQFNHPNLIEIVQGAIESSGLPAHLLELELTETSLMLDITTATTTLSNLKSLGVQLAIDDFGTGYSSLSYLKSFPMDRIKIDRTFVNDLDTNIETAEITSSIIEMAHRLHLEVIAEGVETSFQQNFLRSHDCDQLQGFLYGQAVPAGDLFTMCTQNHTAFESRYSA